MIKGGGGASGGGGLPAVGRWSAGGGGKGANGWQGDGSPGIQRIIPLAAALVGSWGVLPGGALMDAVLGTNDGDASYIQSANLTNYDCVFKMKAFTPRSPLPIAGYSINVVARRAYHNGVSPQAFINPCEFAFGNASTIWTGGAIGSGNIIPASVPVTPYTMYSYTLSTAEIAAVNSNSLWIGFRAGLSNIDLYQITQVYLECP